MKKITLLIVFVFAFATQGYSQFTEGFEAGIPASWTVINGGDANTWVQYNANPVFVRTGTSAAAITYTADAHDDYLITEAITVVAGVNDRFSFWGRSFDPLYPENIDVLISTTTPDAAGLTNFVENVAPDSNLTTFTQYTYDLTAYVGQTIYIGFHSTTQDQWRFSIDDVVNDTAPATAPDCATPTAPLDAATDVDFTAAIVLAWDAPITGPAPDSYDVYLDTNPVPTTLIGNTATLGGTIPGGVLLPSTTYYWTVIATNGAGDATGCTVFSFTTMANIFAPYCGPIRFSNNVEPITLVNFAGINNTTDATVGLNDNVAIFAHEDYTTITGNVTAGSTYPITLKGNTDGNFTDKLNVFVDWNHNDDFTDVGESYQIGDIVNSDGVDAVELVGSIAVPPTALTGNTRMRVIKKWNVYSDSCNTPGTGYGQAEDYTLIVAPVPADLPDFVNLQFPATLSFPQGGSGVVYGRIYEPSVTEAAGPGAGINAWVGISLVGDNSNPNTWTTWVPATFNVQSGNDDEYQATIGATLAPGTYYYATRFTLNNGAYVYGGKNPIGNGGSFWDGTAFISGVLTVLPPVPPANDECTGAIALTPGGTFATNPITATTLAATLVDGLLPSCQTSIINNVWYSVVVPASGNITIETQVASGSAFNDSVVTAYTGTCGALNEIGCDDDGGLPGVNNLMSILSLTGQQAGATLYISVSRFSVAGSGVDGSLLISAYDGSLGNSSFDNANFAYYPNPVKNVLNLSYTQDITKVSVFNLLGQEVYTKSLNATEGIVDMSNLASGAYLVNITADNQTKTIKVIKE